MVTLGCTAETAACMIHETRCTPIYSVYCPREFVRQMLEALNSACPQHFIVPWMVHAFILPLNEVELPAVNKPFTCYWPKLIIKRRSIVSIENGGRIQSYGQNFRGDYSQLKNIASTAISEDYECTPVTPNWKCSHVLFLQLLTRLVERIIDSWLDVYYYISLQFSRRFGIILNTVTYVQWAAKVFQR